jgi:hypothetical protein
VLRVKPKRHLGSAREAGNASRPRNSMLGHHPARRRAERTHGRADSIAGMAKAAMR